VNPVLEPQIEPIRVWHLLTHMSGLTYGFHHATPVDAMYRAAGYEWGAPAGSTLEENCDRWASFPLLFQPGSEWNYGVSTDVLGRLVEVVSGQPLDVFLRERIFQPLGMTDTDFSAPESALDRLAALYVPTPGTRLATRTPMGEWAKETPTFLSGGGGLVSTAADYHRFASMLLNGGELEGNRLLGTRTVRYMTRNHLPGGVDLEAFGRPLFAETSFTGIGFGLGFSVVQDAVENKVLSSVGEFAWGGAASTAFWVDPSEGITALFLTQLLPSSTHPIRPQLKQLVYQALVDSP
jgi:CubicO group peptidase (beta-lactamase class C family)